MAAGAAALAVATLLVTTAAPTAVGAPVAAPGAAQDRTSQFDAATRTQLRADLEELRLAGGFGVVGAAQTDRARFAAATGIRTIDRGAAAQVGDTARVASVTKPMVATLVLQEVQQRRWTLQTRVDQVLPGLLPGHGAVTVQQLLSHRSGLPDYLVPALAGATTNEQFLRVLSRSYTPRQLVRLALTQPWSFAPGSDYGYSNTNYVVLGMMLEKTNRTSADQLLERRVFAPARMTSTSLQTGTRWSQREHLAEYAVLERPLNVDRTNASIFFTAGAVESTPRDLNRFWRALFDGTLVRPALVSTMIASLSPEASYGLGVLSVPGPCRAADGSAEFMYGHDGATYGTQTLSFTTADGRAQASVSWTGRDLTTLESPTTLAAVTYVRNALAPGCTRGTVPPPGTNTQTERLTTVSQSSASAWRASLSGSAAR